MIKKVAVLLDFIKKFLGFGSDSITFNKAIVKKNCKIIKNSCFFNIMCYNYIVFYIDGPLAQLVEQMTLNHKVRGSSPRWSTKKNSQVCKLGLNFDKRI